jgi:hypothetical protein
VTEACAPAAQLVRACVGTRSKRFNPNHLTLFAVTAVELPALALDVVETQLHFQTGHGGGGNELRDTLP